MYKLPKELESKYRFVTLASKRAEQLQMGARPRIDGDGTRKLTVVAQEEVATGVVDVWKPEEEEIQEEGEEE